MILEHAVPSDEAVDLIRHLYRAFLDRQPSDDEVAVHVERLQREGATAAVSIIAYSKEAAAIRARASVQSPPELPGGTLLIGRDDVARVVGSVLAASRREEPSAYEIALRVDDVASGTKLATVLEDAFQVSSPSRHPVEDDSSIDRTIQIMFRLGLGRMPGRSDLDLWRATVTDGGRLSNVVFGIGESAEAQEMRGGLDLVPGLKVQLAFEIVLGRGATAAEVDNYRTMIDGGKLDVAPLVMQLFNDQAKKRLVPPPQVHDPYQSYIFGSRGAVSIASQFGTIPTVTPRLKHDVLGSDSAIRLGSAETSAGTSSGTPVVSIITSLYRGGAFIRSFLENMTSQTIFKTHCELIIVDADSPEREQVVIEEFCRDFSNIVYHRTKSRIGIYEAWNIGIALARGRYITNANLDDLRRADSFEIQAAVLDTFDFADVTYQDVLYSFAPRLSFDEIAARNLCTDLPVVSHYNLMEFNSPHNAPMWRAALHRDVGLFNEALQSAGDFEFWLRCRAAGKVFYKVNEAHAAYFVNPEGISTRPDTRGVVEADTVSRELFRKLISPMLTIADDVFLARIDEVEPAAQRTGRRYDVVQSALIALGTRREGSAA